MDAQRLRAGLQSGHIDARALMFGFVTCLIFVISALILSRRHALSTLSEHRYDHAGLE
jgi:hypothetical protein